MAQRAGRSVCTICSDVCQRTLWRARPGRGETSLWGKVTGDVDVAQRLGAAPTEQDHVDCEVWLGKWSPCDPARDTPMERGMRALRIPLERQVVPDASGRLHYKALAVLDNWARERQARRLIRVDRQETFARVNEQLERIRARGYPVSHFSPTLLYCRRIDLNICSIWASLSGVRASKRRTSCGRFEEARTRPQPSSNTTRAPLISMTR